MVDTSADSTKKLEFTASTSVKSHDPSLTSSRLSDPSSEGAGPASGGGGADEQDAGKSTPHISLGERKASSYKTFYAIHQNLSQHFTCMSILYKVLFVKPCGRFTIHATRRSVQWGVIARDLRLE